MKNEMDEVLNALKSDLIKFAQELVQIKSFTGNEGDVAKHIRDEMLELGYDDVKIDKLGNVIGIIGNGPTKILFDGHMDTVTVDDADDWTVDPFGGEIIDNKLYGRGSCDMKSAIAAIVYAGFAIKKLGLHEGKTIYISASVMEEDCDGGALLYEYRRDEIKPDYVVICEPSGLKLAVGQRGRTSIKITTEGVSCHGSAPERGVNPVYSMNTIIKRVEELNENFRKDKKPGSVALTKIECQTGSINTVPNKCSIYLDRRLGLGEDNKFIEEEMETLLADTDAKWKVIKFDDKSWTGEDIKLDIFFPAWEISKEHQLTQGAVKALEELNNEAPEIFKWDFSTNGVASMGILKIPTIGFGPGDGALAHSKDENCPVEDIIEACRFYTYLPKCL